VFYLYPSHKKSDVVTATATRGELVITVTDRGELESSKSTNVICEVEGGAKIATIVSEGTRVKKGDELCKFDANQLTEAINKQEVLWEQADGKARASKSDFEAQKDKAEQEISKAELALTLAKIDYESYEQGEFEILVDEYKGAIELAKKDLTEAEEGLTLTRRLAKNGSYSLEQLRAAELNVDGKRYDVRQKETKLRVLETFTKRRKVTELKSKAEETKLELARTKKIQKAATEKSESEMKAAQKTADLEKKQYERAKKQLEKCVLKAPQDGIIIYAKRYYWDDESNIRPGANVHYQQPIVTLPDLDQMQVKLRVHESVVKKVQKGQTATILVEALPGVVLHGKVVSVATQAQSQGWRGGAVKEYETIVSIDDLPSDAGLRPGMTGDVKILLKTVPNALTVPVQAVTEFDGKHIAYVVTGGGVERREVKIGETNDTLIQVLEGINEGEQVALDARVRAAAELKTGDGKDAKDDKDKADKDKKQDPPAPAPVGKQ
jgi:HlyD family secretion protein